MRPEDIEAELEAVWNRVRRGGESAPPAAAPSGGGPSAAANVETLHFLKAQYREAQQQLQEMLDLKEQEAADVRTRAREAEARYEEARKLLAEREDELTAMMLRSQAWAEEQTAMFRQVRETHEVEVSKLRALEEELKNKLDEEGRRASKLAADWRAKENALRKDVAELAKLPERLKAELAAKEDEARRLAAAGERLQREKDAALKPLEAAVQSATGRLLEEKQAREASDAARAKAETRAAELEQHLAQLKSAWDAERKQWQELWDRERSTWEVQRAEMKQWEGELRKEREAWLAQLRAEEARNLSLAARIGEALKEGLGPARAALAEAPGLEAWWVRARPWAKRGAAALAAAVFVGGSLLAARALEARLYLAAEGGYAVPVKEATAVALHGDRLWVASWDGRLRAFDPSDPGRPLADVSPKGLGPYRPAALAAAAELWSLDAAQMRIVRHDARDPAKVAWTFVNGGMPTALAHDGERLWVFEGVDGLLFRYRADPKDGPDASFRLAPGWTPSAMQWDGDSLWVYDAAEGRLGRFAYAEGAFRLANSGRLSGASVAVTATHVWELAREGGEAALRRHRRRHP